jgi:hypothetical protein
MANSRDFTGKNRKFTGTKGIVTPKGTTGERVGSESGELRFNTTTELMEYYDGTSWKPIDAPPTISGVTTSDSVGTNTVLNADGSTLFTITITGGNFSINPTVKFIGSTGTEYTAGNINRVSASQITCTTLITMGTTDDPYDVEVTNTSSLAATLDDAFSYNAAPVFTVASGTLGEIYNGQVISGTTLNAGATDAEGNAITHTIISGSLPGSGLSISSSTGAITGTLSGAPSLGNYSFIVRASTTEGVAERQFSIQVKARPFIAATGGTVTEDGDFKVHTFTSGGEFIVTSLGGDATYGNKVEYLVVAGGGGGGGAGHGGGGGAGGYRHNSAYDFTVSATTYTISVGSYAGLQGGQGGTSTFSTISSAGGGQGGYPNSEAGRSGGAGGGGAGHYSSGGGGSGNTPSVSPSQGFAGGSGQDGSPYYGAGGGGGASSVGGNGSQGGTGANSSDAGGGTGGNGSANDIHGSSRTYSAGGGGHGHNQPGTGGSGGLGGFDNTSSGGRNTANNYGMGGGGTADNASSGVVIIRYKFQ